MTAVPAGPPTSRQRMVPILALVGAAVIFGLVCWLRLSVTTEITRFMAPGDDPRAAEVSARLSRSELTRTMVLLVVADADDGDPDGRVAASRGAADVIAARLSEVTDVAWVRTGVGEAQRKAVFELYAPRSLAFGGVDASTFVADHTGDEALDLAAQRLLDELGKPTGTWIKRLAPEDPLLLFQDRLTSLRGTGATELDLAHGGFVTADGRAVVVLSSRGSAFDADAQRAVQDHIAHAVAAAEREFGPLTVEQSGVGRFAIRAESAIRGDITRISILGSVGVILLFVLVFRSMRLMVLSMLPLGFGVLAAMGVCALIFGDVHGLTLAFGASLIGICIDYPVHLFAHASAEEAGSPFTAAAKVRPGLLLGAGTTLVGFVGLGWTSFPGIREIAIFASTGIAAAAWVTLYVLPALMPTHARPGKAFARLVVAAERGLQWLSAHPRLAMLPALAAVGVTVVGLPRTNFVDDPRALTEIDAELLAEDERVRAAVSRMEAGQLVLARGVDDDEALDRNAAVFEALDRARAAGEVETFASIQPWLTSADSQREHVEAWRRAKATGLKTRFDAAFQAVGFRTSTFTPFFDRISSAPPAPLRAEDLDTAGLGDLVSTYRVLDDGGVSYVTYVRGVADPEALAASLAQLDGVVFFDQHATMRRAYERHRMQGLQLVAAGLVAVALVLLLRYRAVNRALAAYLPSLGAAGLTVAILALAGVELHLLHLVSCLLVLSMGVDYGVFLAETWGDGAPTTLVSLVLACLSTVFAFGLLALSSNPALHAVGVTTGMGVAFSLVLAPSMAAWFGGNAS